MIWKLRFESDVVCSDGVCGQLAAVLLSPKENLVTQLIAQGRDRHSTIHLVPLQLVREAGSGRVQLACTRAEFTQLPEFVTRDYIRQAVAPSVKGLPDILFAPGQRVIVRLQISEGETALSGHTRVRTRHWRAGSVKGLWVDSETNQMTHIILQRGFVRPKWRVAVPIHEIGQIGETSIQLKLTRREVNALPPLPNE